MKKIFLLIAATTLSVAAMAQQKGEMSATGTFMITGGNSSTHTNISGSTTTAKTNNPLTFNIGAGFGYFVADNVEVSLGLYYGLNREKNSHSTTDNNFFDSNSSFSIKPEIAYYVPLSAGKFFWTPGFELGLQFNSAKEQINKETTNKVTQPFEFSLGLNILAFEFRPWEHIGFNLSLGGLYYNTSSAKADVGGNQIKTVTHDISFGFDNLFYPELGIKFIF